MVFADFQKNAPTSKVLAEKATTKKRPANAGDTPPPAKSKGFTANKMRADRPILPKGEIPPTVEDTAMIPYVEEIGLAPSTTSKELDAVVLLHDTEGVEEKIP